MARVQNYSKAACVSYDSDDLVEDIGQGSFADIHRRLIDLESVFNTQSRTLAEIVDRLFQNETAKSPDLWEAWPHNGTIGDINNTISRIDVIRHEIADSLSSLMKI